MRSEKEIHEQIDEAFESRDNGGKFNGMSYEEGVIAALEWVLGNSPEKPIEE